MVFFLNRQSASTIFYKAGFWKKKSMQGDNSLIKYVDLLITWLQPAAI